MPELNIQLPSDAGRDDPILKPAVDPPEDVSKAAVFVFCHGLADSAMAIENIADQFQQGGKLPHMTWILPNAKENRLQMDTAWFLPNTIPHLKPSRPELEPDEDEKGMLETVAYLESIVDSVVASGVQPNRIVLGGFSQGCAMSLMTFFLSSKYSGKLAGIVGLLGYLPLVDGKERVEELRVERGMDRTIEGSKGKTRFLMSRGTKDEFIPYRAWAYTLEALKRLGIEDGDVETKSYEIGHTINGAVLRDMCSWLEGLVPEISS